PPRQPAVAHCAPTLAARKRRAATAHPRLRRERRDAGGAARATRRDPRGAGHPGRELGAGLGAPRDLGRDAAGPLAARHSMDAPGGEGQDRAPPAAFSRRGPGRAFPVARWRTPQYRPVFRVLRAPDSAFSWYGPPPDTVFPSGDRPGYTGPIAVLASNATAGAAEDFLVAFRNATRGVIIGETSAGSPGEALTIALPKNWAMQLSVTRHAFPNGEEFAGKGIQPELTVSSTVA